jgi:hypothetical protein
MRNHLVYWSTPLRGRVRFDSSRWLSGAMVVGMLYPLTTVGLSVGFHSIRSIEGKRDQIDVLGISVSWLKPKT